MKKVVSSSTDDGAGVPSRFSSADCLSHSNGQAPFLYSAPTGQREDFESDPLLSDEHFGEMHGTSFRFSDVASVQSHPLSVASSVQASIAPFVNGELTSTSRVIFSPTHPVSPSAAAAGSPQNCSKDVLVALAAAVAVASAGVFSWMSMH